MKRKVLIIISCTLFMAMQAFTQNLIKDGDFESGVLDKNTNDPNAATNGGQRGVWYFRTYAGLDASIVDLGEERGKVAKIERGTPAGFSWYRSFICQWNAEDAEPIHYRLTFKAKKESGEGKLRTHMKSTTRENESCFILKGQEFKTGYAAQKDIQLTEEWETYVIDYDFKYIVNTIYSVKEENKETAYSEATEEDLKNFFICFYPERDNTTILIDDVRLAPIVRENNLIQDGNFDSGLLMRGTLYPDQVGDARGIWYYKVHDKTTGSIVNTGNPQGNAAMMERGDNAGISYYGSYIAQWIDGSVMKTNYRLKFRAKKEGNTSSILRVYMKTGGADRFFIRQGTAFTSGAPAIKDFNLTNEWETYYIDYDFNYTVPNIYTIQPENVETSYFESTEDQLSSIFVSFYPERDNTNILIDDVSLIPFVRNQGTDKGLILEGVWDLDTFYNIINAYDITSITTMDLTNVEDINALPIIESLNPNCLFYVNSNVTGEEHNIVVISQEGASAQTITLSEGDYFNNTHTFTATNISYTRDFTDMPFASFLLPFVPENMDDIVLEELTEMKTEGENTTAIFKKVDNITANTPYIAKLESKVGEKTFTATNVEIVATPTEISSEVSNGYVLKGNYQLLEGEDAVGLYLLKTDGSYFAKGTVNSQVPAFRSYLEYVGNASPARSIGVEHENDDITSIDTLLQGKTFEVISNSGKVEIYTSEYQTVSIYALDGRMVQKINIEPGYNIVPNLSKGIYLINNQKVVVR